MWSMIRHKPLLIIILCAFALRAGAAIALQWRLDHTWERSYLIVGDAKGYWDLGKRMADGQPFQIHDPPRRVLRMPGFPAVLALSIKLFGESFLAARMMLAGVGTVACLLVYFLGKELFGEAVGLWASLLCAVLPTMIGFSVLILSETLFAATLLGSLLAIAKLLGTGFDSRDRVRAIGLSLTVGATVGLACYARPSWLLVGPMVCVYFLIRASVADNKKESLLRGVLIMASLAAVLFPWVLRNHRVTGHWVVTTLWAGPSLYDGFNPEASGDSDLTFFDRDSLMSNGVSEWEMNRHYSQKAIEYAFENPERAVVLGFKKLWRFWKPWPNARQFSGLFERIVVASFFVPLLVLAVRGGWVCRGDARSWILAVAPIVYFSIIHAVFVGSLRYRLPAEYPLYLLSAVGLQSWLPAKWQFFGTDDVRTNASVGTADKAK